MAGSGSYLARNETVERQWFVVDATDRPAGRLAAQIARILTGKHRPTFTPHVDTGDFVIVVNAEKVKLTGKKGSQSHYHYHTAQRRVSLDSVGCHAPEKTGIFVRARRKGNAP